MSDMCSLKVLLVKRFLDSSLTCTGLNSSKHNLEEIQIQRIRNRLLLDFNTNNIHLI